MAISFSFVLRLKSGCMIVSQTYNTQSIVFFAGVARFRSSTFKQHARVQLLPRRSFPTSMEDLSILHSQTRKNLVTPAKSLCLAGPQSGFELGSPGEMTDELRHKV